MADRGDTHYRVPALNLWFAFSSLVLLVSAFWMVLDDWNRPWKHYQREFRRIEAERARGELAQPEAVEIVASEEEIEARLAEAQARLDARSDELAEAERELAVLDNDLYVATEAAKSLKQAFNWERWEIEEHHLHEDVDGLSLPLRELEGELAIAEGEKEVKAALLAEAEARMAELKSEVDAIETELAAIGKPIALTRTKLDKLDPDAPDKVVANIIRDFPGLDFVEPNLKVNKVVLSDLTFELNFMRKPRIDMCMTCHVASDRAGFYEGDDADENGEGGLEHPYLSHPRLDLFLTAKSPHPYTEVGCTICHRGMGEALHFTRTDHRPTDEAQAHEWHDEYHWHKQHHWDYPMLRSQDVEASCTQCHKTSMELIASEAPRVTEGYRTFERYGCYACHKVEWFPTKRKPGPSLKGIAQKVQDRDWVDAWIADPKSFRPTTWMPQIFHLENYAPEEEIVVSNWGEGRPILGQEWNETAVAAVSAFIFDRATERSLDPIPVEGDAARGRELFRLTGCLACHNMAPHEGEDPGFDDIAFERRSENEHGPNLRGVTSKVTREWLYGWIKDPSSYWSETRMPNLRLSDQEAADIVAYMFDDPEGTFTDVPDDWSVQASGFDREALEEQARWYYSRLGRAELRRRFDDDWKDDSSLLIAVGEKLVEGHGCHSCHEIGGLEGAMPIGTELTNWASKTVDKLDMGFIPEILAEQHGWDHHETEQWKKYREGWLAQKLHAPRSYDRRKVKNPTEKLRMPWFDFSEEQIGSLVTFVGGLVDDEVERAKMIPTPAQAQMDAGMRAVRQHNCAACHVIEPGKVTFFDEEGDLQMVHAELIALEDATMPPRMTSDMEAFLELCARHDEEYDVETEELGMRLLEPAPGLGVTGDNVFAYLEDVVSMTPPWGGDFVNVVTDYYYNGVPQGADEEGATGDPDGERRVQDADGEWRPYYDEEYDKVRWTYAPPVLFQEGHKLQKNWFYEFLGEPMPLREQMRVRMPTFNFAEGEAGAIADFFAHKAVKDWPSFFARKMRTELDEGIDEVADGAGLSESMVRGIEEGSRPSIEAGLKKLLAYADESDYHQFPAVDPSFESIMRRSPSHLAYALEAQGDTERNALVLGEEVARNGPNCFQCHFQNGVPPLDGEALPIAWAPDLARVRERLREDWVEEWLWDPSKKYPGTAMPANFGEEPQYLDVYPDSTSEEQIGVVMDWLYNMDRAGQPLGGTGTR